MEEKNFLELYDGQKFLEEEGWQIDDAGKADWAVGKIGECNSKIKKAQAKFEEVKKFYEEKISQAESILADEIAPFEKSINRLTDKLATFAEKKLTDGQKNYKLPSGTLKLTKQRDKFIFDDGTPANRENEQLIDWLSEHAPEFVLIRVKRTADWEGLKKELFTDTSDGSVCTKDGEIIPGLKVYPQPQKFSVVLKEDKQND